MSQNIEANGFVCERGSSGGAKVGLATPPNQHGKVEFLSLPPPTLFSLQSGWHLKMDQISSGCGGSPHNPWGTPALWVSPTFCTARMVHEAHSLMPTLLFVFNM